MRGLLCEGVMIWVPLDMRGLLCEGVMIWVPLDLSH